MSSLLEDSKLLEISGVVLRYSQLFHRSSLQSPMSILARFSTENSGESIRRNLTNISIGVLLTGVDSDDRPPFAANEQFFLAAFG